MAAFNPDAYLAQKTQPIPQSQPQAFNPDAYLAAKQGEKAPTVQNPQNADWINSLGAGALKMADTATLGYAPELAAGVEKFKSVFPGYVAPEGLEGKSVGEIADIYRQRGKKLEAQSPWATGTGNALGMLAGGGALSEGMQAAPIIGKAIQAGQEGGAIARAATAGFGGAIAGGTQNPEGGSRLQNAAVGAAGGVLLQPAIEAVSKLPGALSELSDQAATRAVGFNKKALKDLNAKGIKEDVLAYARSAQTPTGEALIKPGDTHTDVFRKSGEILTDTGQKIGDIYKQATNLLETPGALQNVSPELKQKFFNVQPTGDKLVQELKEVTDPIFKNSLRRQSIEPQVATFIDEIAGRGNNVRSIGDLQGYIKELDGDITWSKDPRSGESPKMQQVYYALRTKLRQKINDLAQVSGEVLGKDYGNQIRDLNKQYANTTRIYDASLNKMSAEEANQFFGLGDKMAAAGSGVMASLQHGITPALAAGAGAVANKLARNYGPSVAAPLLSAGATATQPLTNLGLITPTTVGAAGGMLANQVSQPQKKR